MQHVPKVQQQNQNWNQFLHYLRHVKPINAGVTPYKRNMSNPPDGCWILKIYYLHQDVVLFLEKLCGFFKKGRCELGTWRDMFWEGVNAKR